MHSSIYYFSPELLESIGHEINSYLRAKPFSTESSSVMDFHRENFIAQLNTRGCAPETIYEMVNHYTNNQLLTEAILSCGGGQALFSTPQAILSNLHIADEILDRYYKTGTYRRLIYTKSLSQDHFINLYMCIYGMRNGGNTNLVLNRKTGMLERIDNEDYQAVFPFYAHNEGKHLLESQAREQFDFDIAPLAAVYLRLKIRNGGQIEFIPVLTKLAINSSLLHPVDAEKMHQFKTYGATADLAIYQEFWHHINNDLMQFTNESHPNSQVINLAKKLDQAFYYLRTEDYNFFLISLEEFYLRVREYIGLDSFNKKVKPVSQDDIIVIVMECLSIIKPDLRDLTFICYLIASFPSDESSIAKIRYSLAQIYYALNSYLSETQGETIVRETTDESRFKLEKLDRIFKSINFRYLISEYRKAEFLHIIRVKATKISYDYVIPTLMFEGEQDPIEDLFYLQLQLCQKLCYSSELTLNEYRLMLLERLHSLSMAISFIDRNEVNEERKNYIINKLSEILGIIQSYLYLIHNTAFTPHTITASLELLFDSTIFGKRNPHLENREFFGCLFSEADIDDYSFPDKANKVLLAYLISVSKNLASPPENLGNHPDLLKILASLKSIEEEIKAHPERLIDNSLGVYSLICAVRKFSENNQSYFNFHFKFSSNQWLRNLNILFNEAEQNAYVLYKLCQFFLGHLYLVDLLKTLAEYLDILKENSNSVYERFFSSSPWKQNFATFLERLTSQSNDDSLLCEQYKIIELSQPTPVTPTV